MKKVKFWLIASLAVILIFRLNGLNPSHAISNQDKDGDKGCESKIDLPWQEFKELLKLYKDEIELTLEELNRLLQQTDPELKPEYRLIDGKVVLSRNEFKNIVDHLKALPQDETAPIREYLFTKAVYTGKMDQDDFAFSADFTLSVLKEEAYLKIPVLSASLALRSMTINERPAIVINERGYHCLIIDHPGDYTVKALFSIKSSLDKGPHRLQFPIQEIPITLIDLEMPVADIEVEMTSAQYLETIPKGDKTVVKAILADCRSFDLQWKKRVVTEEKTPAMIYAESYQLISVEDDALKINQDLFYNILQSGVDSLQLEISDGVTILSVLGPGVGDWREIEKGNQRFLFIPLDYEQKGKFKITVLAEKPFEDGSTMIEFAGLKVLDTVNALGEKGYIGVELKTGAELVLVESSGLEKVTVKSLSGQLFNKSTNPLILGFKYLKHPYNLVLDVKKHEKVALPQATIDSAGVVSFFTEDGLIINKMDLSVKNQLKQSLQLRLPEGALIWSAIVGQESVEVRQDKDILYIPLISSRLKNEKLESFKVELIYYTESPKFSLWGQRHITLPQADLTISQILWSVYLPEKFVYYRFITNLEKEELASGLTPILNREKTKVDMPGRMSYEGRVAGPGPESRIMDMVQDYSRKRGQTAFRNIDVNGKFMSDQTLNEFDFDNRLQQIEDKMIQGDTQVYTGTGVLPMNIQIPSSGQLYRFAKNIVRDEKLEINICCCKDILLTAAAWFVILILILLIVFFRKRLGSMFSYLAGQVKNGIQTGVPPLKRFFLSKWSLVVLGLLFLFSLALGVFAKTICFLVLWTSGMVHLDKGIRRSKSKAKKSKTRKGAKTFILFLLALSGFVFSMRAPFTHAQNAPIQQQGPQVSLDWNEFKTSIGLDKDEIILTWDEFQKIVNQTPKRTKPVYTIQNGKVRLNREQFDKLLDQMILPLKESPIPLDYRLTKAVYKGKMTQNWTAVKADFILEVLNKKDYKLIPFLSSQLGMQDVQINDKPALLLTEGGYHKLVIKEPGQHRITAVFYMKSSLNKADYQISIPVLETSITLLELEIPMEDITIKAPQAQQTTVSAGRQSTLVKAIFPPVRNLAVQWYGKKAAPEAQKIPAKIYAQSYSLVSIEDDALKVNMDIEFNILHAGIDELALLIPEGLNILSVKGQGVGKWRESRRDDRRVLYIKLDYEHKGIFLVTIEYEKTLLEAANRFSFSTLEVLEAVKDTGYLGLELKSGAEVNLIKYEGLEKIAVQKLPQQLFQKSLKPLIFGFKYLKHPCQLELDIRRNPKVSVTMAVIDSANAVSFFTEDGKIVHRIIYEVRNQLKQFLKIRLPEGAELWSVFVGDKPSEPAREKDLLYIPLIRSREEGRGLKPFRIEIVYYQKAGPFSAFGKKSILLPRVTEIIVSKILWSLYLPKDYNFLYFGGTLEKERLVSGIRPIMGCSCSTFKRAHRLSEVISEGESKPSMDSIDEEIPISTESREGIWSQKEEKGDKAEFQKFKASRKDMMKQQAMEKSFTSVPRKISEPQKPQPQEPGVIASGYDTAVFSIPISVPLSGQLYRFAKTLVRQEPLLIKMVYTRGWIMQILGWFILIIAVIGLFATRKSLYRAGQYFQRSSQYMENGLSELKSIINKAYNLTVTPLILAGFFIAAVLTLHLFLAFLIFLAGLCVVVHQSPYWFPKGIKEGKPKQTGKDISSKPPSTEAEIQPKKKKWIWAVLLSLGVIIFVLGSIIFVISSIGRYPNHRIIFFTAVLATLYYIGLFIVWLIRRIVFRVRG
ncbi:hypothetical protein JXL19_12635 [bacterium]|nr:hypothetical protein [bacterium]